MLRPASGDYVVEPVKGATAEHEFRVLRYGWMVASTRHFPSRSTALAHAIEMALLTRCSAFLREQGEWTPLVDLSSPICAEQR